MYFSHKSTLSRVLSLVLVLAMTVCLFSGCGKKEDSTTDTSNSGLNLDLTGTGGPAVDTQPEATETTPPKINENTATVTSQLNIRSSPSTEATVIGTLYAGDKVEISRREEVVGIDWAYIIYPEAGWIVMEFVEMDIPSEQPPVEDTTTPGATATTEATEPTPTTGNAGNNGQGTRGVITASTLNIRQEPSKTAKAVGGYVKGDVVTILETRNGWGRTNKGWISMDYVSTTGGNNNNNNNNNNNGGTATATQFSGIVTASELNVRDSASQTGNRVGMLTYGTRVEILEKSGTWGKTKDGWISLDYVYQDGTTGKNPAKGIVTGSNLNVRSGPGTGYGSVGSLNAGDRVNILEQFTYNGVTWGCTSKGWISLQYVYIDGTGNGNDITATVTGSNLNVRSGPGTNYDSVGSLNANDVVTILFQVKVGNTTWGNIKNGWISMDYVRID